MTNVLTGVFEITLGMSAVIAVCALLLLAFGKKLTAKSRYLIWSLIVLRLAVPVSWQIMPPVFELPTIPAAEVTLPVTGDGAEDGAHEKLPQNNEVIPETGENIIADIENVPVETDEAVNGNLTVPDAEKPTVTPEAPVDDGKVKLDIPAILTVA